MNKLDKFFKAIERDKESMRERIKKYTEDELLSLDDAVTNCEPLDLGTIMKKHRGLTEILDSAPGSEYEDWPEYQQAESIILNATRLYYQRKNKNV